jgi:hypothetical protein
MPRSFYTIKSCVVQRYVGRLWDGDASFLPISIWPPSLSSDTQPSLRLAPPSLHCLALNDVHCKTPPKHTTDPKVTMLLPHGIIGPFLTLGASFQRPTSHKRRLTEKKETGKSTREFTLGLGQIPSSPHLPTTYQQNKDRSRRYE